MLFWILRLELGKSRSSFRTESHDRWLLLGCWLAAGCGWPVPFLYQKLTSSNPPDSEDLAHVPRARSVAGVFGALVCGGRASKIAFRATHFVVATSENVREMCNNSMYYENTSCGTFLFQTCRTRLPAPSPGSLATVWAEIALS